MSLIHTGRWTTGTKSALGMISDWYRIRLKEAKPPPEVWIYPSNTILWCLFEKEGYSPGIQKRREKPPSAQTRSPPAGQGPHASFHRSGCCYLCLHSGLWAIAFCHASLLHFSASSEELYYSLLFAFSSALAGDLHTVMLRLMQVDPLS